MQKIKIGYLYGNLMNLYGDRGNILTLLQRAKWRGIEVSVKDVGVGDRLSPGDFDILFFGGGQDQAQDIVSEDLARGNGLVIKTEVEQGVPLLSVCGGYQLLGKYYQPKKGAKIPGVGVFDAHTVAGDDRMVGNLLIEVEPTLAEQIGPPKTLIGFENHSGQTFLGREVKPLGKVMVGSGNNGQDKTEGAVYKNAIGTYLHGSLLPKNPHLADWLLVKALESSKQDPTLAPLDNSVELSAHSAAVTRAKEVR